jgi:hypothetical protein
MYVRTLFGLGGGGALEIRHDVRLRDFFNRVFEFPLSRNDQKTENATTKI